MLSNYTIGVVGPLCGLSDHQVKELREEIATALRSAAKVTLRVWCDETGRHVTSEKPDGMLASADALRHKLSTDLVWVDYQPVPNVTSLWNLGACDTVFFCPAHAHSSNQRSRVWTLKRFADESALRHQRLVYSWNKET